MELAFFIIYTKHTLSLLWPFTETLINNSNAKFVLVSNNCTTQEDHFLQKKALNNIKLDFIKLPFDKIVPHHVALMYLYTEYNPSEYFCFMDSDILAKGPFISEFKRELISHDAIFSCRPIWSENDNSTKDVPRLLGKHIYSRFNFLVGSSYFAIYKRELLDNIITNEKIDFRRYYWSDLSSEHQKLLKKNNLIYEWYDTAKVLNIFIKLCGYNSKHLEHENLYHIGGITSYNHLLLRKGSSEPRYDHMTNNTLIKIKKTRINVTKYFFELIKHYKEGLPEPILPGNLEKSAEIKIIELKDVLRNMKYETFSIYE